MDTLRREQEISKPRVHELKELLEMLPETVKGEHDRVRTTIEALLGPILEEIKYINDRNLDKTLKNPVTGSINKTEIFAAVLQNLEKIDQTDFTGIEKTVLDQIKKWVREFREYAVKIIVEQERM